MAFDPAFTPDEKFVWVPVKSSNEIVVVDAAAWKEVARIKDAPTGKYLAKILDKKPNARPVARGTATPASR